MGEKRKRVFQPRACVVCGKEYTPTAGHQKVCSRKGECFLAYDREYRRNSPKRKALERERERRRKQDPKVREYRRQWLAEKMADPECRAKYNARQLAYTQRPEVKARLKSRRDWRWENDPEFVRRALESTRKAHARMRANPDRLAKHRTQANANYRKRNERKALLELARAAGRLEAKL